MSVCGQSGQAEEDSASEEVGAPVRDKTSDTYKQKSASKVVRVLTVLAYLFSVSLAAILLSVYYICVWKSPELPPELNALRGNHSDYRFADYDIPYVHSNGGSDTPVSTVNISNTHIPTGSTTDGYTNLNVSDSNENSSDVTAFDFVSTTQETITEAILQTTNNTT